MYDYIYKILKYILNRFFSCPNYLDTCLMGGYRYRPNEKGLIFVTTKSTFTYLIIIEMEVEKP